MRHAPNPGRNPPIVLYVAALALFGVFCSALPAAQAGQSGKDTSVVHITLLGTTDLHGHIDPIDYYSNKPAQLGLAKIVTLVRRVRAEQPNVLLLDSGDIIQGLPIVYRSAQSVRDLIIEHLTRTGIIPATANHNWHIEPQGTVEALRQAAGGTRAQWAISMARWEID